MGLGISEETYRGRQCVLGMLDVPVAILFSCLVGSALLLGHTILPIVSVLSLAFVVLLCGIVFCVNCFASAVFILPFLA